MKLLLILFVVSAGTMFNSCEKQQPLTETFKAKYVAGMCADHIVQVLDSAYFDKGMNWTNSAGQSFTNVFAIANHCDFAAAGIKPGDTFNCVIVDSALTKDCVTCLAFMETPTKKWNIRVVK